ncbi:MAG: Holliday junction branch migration protein RuvA [Patescibacteria group bacterium]|nr:MAG: Holliday junction branch migration protein RuvA [Patescibacteria group bacterium]
MISHLRGGVVLKRDRFVILETGGVGYKVYVSLDTFRKIKDDGKEVAFWTHLAVRENALDLYGFTNYGELEFFELLIGISGIGPKSALAILGVAPIDTLREAIATGDTSYLTKVSGIGKKNAEKIVLELRDKLGTSQEAGGARGIGLKEEADVIDALVSLGYSAQEAREALKRVAHEVKGVSNRIKETLKHLGR